MGYQNFFATRLFTDIGAADTTITLENPPAVTSGRLVLEARNTSKREIISYTGVSGNDITGVTRGVGGSSATDHAKNSLVEMNVVAEDLEDALNVPNDIETRFDEVISDHVATGLVVTDDTGLTADISAGVAYINGIRVDVAAVNNRAFTASKDTYVDLGDNGVLDYNEVSNGATPPALAASHLRLARVVTNATDTTEVFNYQNGASLVADDGWEYGKLPAVTGITYNGNRNYTMTFASSVASILSKYMRMKFVKSLAGNSYMGGVFNGSSHYFVKTSPTGTLGTITNNFTIEAVVQPTVYPSSEGTIVGRSDATGANEFSLRMQTTGQITIFVNNGGTGNSRLYTTYQSLPLSKKTHVAATWQGGTAYKIYFDGIEMSTYGNTYGTFPTTAGTGGDFAIGRLGSYTSGEYFAGLVSNVGIFNAVLSEATIRDHATRKLTGAETNCIGAWSLDNTANDQSAAGNNLTAQGGVGFSAVTPHGRMGNAVEPLQSCGLVMSVSADGLTVNVQCPEMCTIPTTGGLSAVYYSTTAVPFGWVPEEGRWMIESLFRNDVNITVTTGGVWVSSSANIYIPEGAFKFGMIGNFASQTTGASSVRSGWAALANNAPTNGAAGTSDGGGDYPIIRILGLTGQAAHAYAESYRYRSGSASTYTVYGQSDSITATETVVVRASQGAVRLYAIPAGL